MTPHDLIAAFDVLADAPDGVKRLRELVLSLAVRGKLVAQDERDEPAVRLLRRIAEANSASRRAARRGSETPAVVPIENFDLPTSWAWTTVEGCTSYVRRGKSPTYDDGGATPVVSQKCVQWAGFDLSRARRIADGSVERYDDEQWVRAGDLLWNSTGLGTLGRIMPFVPSADHPRVVVDSHVTIVRPAEIDHRFLWCWLAGPAVQRVIDELSTGSTKQTELATKVIEAIPVPLPPLAEQRRIVARVDELMGLLDRLEAARTTRDAVRRAARDAALADLRDAPDAEAVEAAWSRIARQMDDLFDEPEDVAPLRQAALQLAVRGRLAEQDSRHRPTQPESTTEQGVFPAPPGWHWSSLGELTSLITSGSRGWKVYYADTGASFIRSQDIKYDRLYYDDRAFVELPPGVEGTRTLVTAGDWLITITGANVGKCAYVETDPGEAYVSQHVALVRPADSRLGRFGHIWLTAEHGGRGLLLGHSYGAKPGLNLTQLRELPFPVPPFEEQLRIVAKVDALMALCDDLEARLTSAGDLHGQFAGAAVHHLDV